MSNRGYKNIYGTSAISPENLQDVLPELTSCLILPLHGYLQELKPSTQLHGFSLEQQIFLQHMWKLALETLCCVMREKLEGFKRHFFPAKTEENGFASQICISSRALVEVAAKTKSYWCGSTWEWSRRNLGFPCLKGGRMNSPAEVQLQGLSSTGSGCPGKWWS